jgi:hypothetical protein
MPIPLGPLPCLDYVCISSSMPPLGTLPNPSTCIMPVIKTNLLVHHLTRRRRGSQDPYPDRVSAVPQDHRGGRMAVARGFWAPRRTRGLHWDVTFMDGEPWLRPASGRKPTSTITRRNKSTVDRFTRTNNPDAPHVYHHRRCRRRAVPTHPTPLATARNQDIAPSPQPTTGPRRLVGWHRDRAKGPGRRGAPPPLFARETTRSHHRCRSSHAVATTPPRPPPAPRPACRTLRR